MKRWEVIFTEKAEVLKDIVILTFDGVSDSVTNLGVVQGPELLVEKQDKAAGTQLNLGPTLTLKPLYHASSEL